MGIEIERKFLVDHEAWNNIEHGLEMGQIFDSVLITQGYLNSDPNRTVRIRTMGNDAFITVKGINTGWSRLEWEYPIPYANAVEMMKLCLGKIIKVRNYVYLDGVFGHKRWEVDVFQGNLKGLIIAELELKSEREEFILPPWVRKEVSDDPRYFNSNLLNLTSDMY